MKLYSYVVVSDVGFAPNPFHGYCTLATCKPVIRRVATVGDWVAGTGSQAHNRQHKLVYVMQISEVMSFGDYWSDRRFECKRPNWAGNEVQKAGDNIYRPLNSGVTAAAFEQKASYHSNRDRSSNPNTMKHDTKTDRVLISKRFWYWGGSGPDIPPAFLGIFSNWPTIRALRNHRSQFPPKMLDAFVDWVHSFGHCGILGSPFDSIKNQACPVLPMACVKRTS